MIAADPQRLVRILVERCAELEHERAILLAIVEELQNGAGQPVPAAAGPADTQAEADGRPG